MEERELNTAPEPPPRRMFLPIMGGLLLFYLAVFSALELVGFNFPLSILGGFFVFAAIPTGLLVIGAVYLSYLLRLQFGGQARKVAATTYVSLFIGTTVLVSAYFVVNFPEWKAENAAEMGKVISERATPDLPAAERQALAEELEAFWLIYLSSAHAEDDALQDPRVLQAFELVVTAVTDEQLDSDEVRRLRSALADAFPALPQTAPPTALDPEES